MSAGTRTVVLVTAVVAAAIALIVFLYGQGLLPVAGVFAAMVVGPAIVFWRIALLARRRKTVSKVLVDRLKVVAETIDAERRSDPVDRLSQATTVALLDAHDLADQAVQRFAWGDEATAGRHVAALVSLPGREGWGDSPLVREIGALEEPLAHLARVVGKIEAMAARRQR